MDIKKVERYQLGNGATFQSRREAVKYVYAQKVANLLQTSYLFYSSNGEGPTSSLRIEPETIIDKATVLRDMLEEYLKEIAKPENKT